MDTRTLLLELHCEEIPARFLEPLTQEFSEAFTKWAGEQKLSLATIHIDYSPRKMAWRMAGLPVSQADQTETQVGPPQRMCVDEAGAATQTGLKFAEKWGVDFSAVRFEQPAGKKEACAVVTLTKAGRPTLELLAEALPKLIAGLHVPKAMRWGNSEFAFVRPIRSILGLLGETIIPFEVDGVKAGNTTWGHRLFHLNRPEPVTVARPEDYEAVLLNAGVVVAFQERKARMLTQLEALATEVGGCVVEDEELANTLAQIVEFPRILRGEFPQSFLDLPKEVLVTSLKEHQKSFCIENAKGDLLPYFLTAANRPDDPEGFVQAGNEWVLRARLYDARFFVAEDRRTPLASRLDKLKQLTFHRELGSYFDKSERVTALVTSLATRLSNDAGHVQEAAQAAQVCKCDLVTLMVGEFPELQGVMGGEYLKHEGAPEAVWQAVKEHYQPISAEAPTPTTAMGSLLAVADKLDTVVGCFAIGQIPTGSKDPLALRRAGQGIVRILWERGWNLNIETLLDLSLAVLKAKATKPEMESREALLAFFRDRVAYQLEVAGYPGAARRSALATGWSDLTDLKARCEALSTFAEDARFASLAQSAKRIGNILKDETPVDAFDGAVLQQEEEKALAGTLGHLEATSDYPALLANLAELAQPLEAFFNSVMVKCEDAPLRAARLSLLQRLRNTFLRVADFSQWQ
ncbi:MAG: glycine--tRNA ligase subunit beta [Holophaga sp.]|nr:glycine--tRNA ligase subunit beta [Holophaga sp.]